MLVIPGYQFNTEEIRLKAMSDNYRHLLLNVGEDPSRGGLLKTPERAAKALQFFTKGYSESLTGGTIWC